jgi:branched-chain amino acid transport system substrate-binding protein
VRSLLVGAAMFGAAVTGASAGTADVKPLPGSFCAPIVKGEAAPQFLIVSDFPLRFFPFHDTTLNFQRAVTYVLRQRHFKAGRFAIGYQACDDSSPQSGSGSFPKCISNARAYAANPAVIGEIGTWNSQCSKAELPTLNRAASGPLALISPSNTDVALTHAGGGTAAGEPQRYFPTGKRSFARVISPDDAQAVAEAVLASRLGLRKVFLLDDGSSYGLDLASAFRSAAPKLRLRIAGTRTWSPDQVSFDKLAAAVAKAKPDGVYLAGFECPACGGLLKALHGALGAKVALIASDGFSADDMAKAAGAAAEGFYASTPGLPTASLPAAGRKIERLYGPPRLGSGGPAYAAQAAVVLLDAIAASDGTRASVASHLLEVRIRNGFIGSFHFDRHGDPSLNPVMIFRVRHGKGALDRVITPPANLIP